MKLILFSKFTPRSRRAIVGFAFFAVCAASQAQFQLLVTESPSGSVGPAQWQGVRRYNINSPGGAATLGNGIPKALLNDPAGLAFSSSGELFVGNRHGNSAASSISRFNYDSVSDTYVANGSITGNSLFGVHGIEFSKTGELFATNVNGPISRFTFSGSSAVANGTMGSGASRDIFFSEDGKWAYATQGITNNLIKYDLTTGNQVNSFAISGAASLHNGSWRNGQLFLGAIGSGSVHALNFDSNGDVESSSVVANVASAISLAFSPDQDEMFVAGHNTGLISRFQFSGGSWISNGTINTGLDMGDIIVAPVPEPASLAAIVLGIAAFARRKRNS